jgi:YfiH family protein
VRLGPAEVRFTTRHEGDQRAAPPADWTALKQVHGSRVVVVEHPGQHTGEEADAAVTKARGAKLAVFTADCAPVAFASVEGVIGVAHAGWKGLAAGVLERTAEAMRELGATHIEAALGPCIHPECYEFGSADLGVVAAVLGHTVRGRTEGGRPALNLPAGVRAALTRAGVALNHVDERCTSCAADELYSHRARKESERQAVVVWIP